jgi:hypothetical protein
VAGRTGRMLRAVNRSVAYVEGWTGNMIRPWILMTLVAGMGLGGCVPTDGGSSGNDNENGNANVNNNDNGSGNVPVNVDIAVVNEGAVHLPVGQQATYTANPPASGPHWSAFGIAPVAAGFYEEELEEEQWIHNLEHGYVVVLYDCKRECSQGLLNDLEEFFQNAPPSPAFGNVKLVISRYSGLPYRLTAVAWDVQRHFDIFDEAGLVDFYTTYVDTGPEAVP